MLSFALKYRRCLWTAAAVLPLGVVLAADPTWAESAGVDVWNYADLAREIEDCQADRDRLAAEDVEIQDRMALKEQLVTDLIAGRTTLPEVTSQFAAINAVRPEYMVVIRINFPGDTDEEKVARNVIEYALPRLDSDPRRADVLARLDREFRVMFPNTAAVAH